jgi:hypothetical protein
MDSSTDERSSGDVWSAGRTSLIDLLTEVDAEAQTRMYIARGERPRDPIKADTDLARLVAIRRLRDSALAVEDLALASMMVPTDATPSVEVVGRALGMSRQGARKRIKAAQARMEAQAAAGGVNNPGGPATESASGGGLEPARTLRDAVGILDAITALLTTPGSAALVDKIASCAEDLARYAALHPGGEESAMARADIGSDWAYRLRGALHSDTEA